MICRTRSGSARAITGRSGVRSSRREPRRSARALNSRGDLAGEGAEVDGAGLDHHRAGVELGEVEQVGRELGQAVDLLAHRAHELGPLLGARVLVFEQLDEAAEAEDRGAQLVRGVGDELLAGAVELGQAALHLVEGAGERAELAGGGDRDRCFEVAVGDFACRVLQAADAAGRHLRVVEAEGGRDRRTATRPPIAICALTAPPLAAPPIDDRVDVDDDRRRGDRHRDRA